MADQETRVQAIIFDLTESINDLLHELKELVKDVDRLKQKTGLK